VAYPTPPSLAPASGLSKATAQNVLAVAGSLSRGIGFTAAARLAGIDPSRAAWIAKAEDGRDPFWAWACACFEMGEALYTSRIEETAAAVALDPESKHFGRIAALVLARKSPDYAPVSEKREVGHGGAQITIQNLQVLLGSGDMGDLTKAAFSGPALEGVLDAVEEAAPAPRAAERRWALTTSEPRKDED